MTTHSETFVVLKRLLQQPPSEGLFVQISDLFPTGEASEAAYAYLSEHIALWPAHIMREAPPAWLGDKLQRVSRLVSCCNRIYVENSRAEEHKRLTADQWRNFLGSPHLNNLTSLQLEATHLDDAGVRALAQSPQLAQLTHLDLASNHISDEGAQALAQSPHMTNLIILMLGGNPIGDEGARALERSPFLTNICLLYLENNEPDVEG